MRDEVNAELNWTLSFDTGEEMSLILVIATALIALAAIAFTMLILRGLGGRLENFSSFGEALRRFPLSVIAATVAAILFSKDLLDKFQREFGSPSAHSRAPTPSTSHASTRPCRLAPRK